MAANFVGVLEFYFPGVLLHVAIQQRKNVIVTIMVMTILVFKFNFCLFYLCTKHFIIF